MGGKKSTVIDTTPKVTQDLRKGLQDYIMDPKAGGVGRINAQTPDLPTSTGITAAGPVATQFNIGGADPSRGQVRDVSAGPGVTAQQVSSRDTSSVDSLGGANSAFFNNMVAQLQPSFTQQRNEGLAGAKESAGTLTGSSFANRLGSSINRSLGNEQATLANYASQGIGMEQARQAGDANRALSAATANQGASLQAGLGNQNASLSAQQANQGADMNFINQMLQRSQQGLAAQGMTLQAQSQNQQTELSQNTLAAQLEAQRKAMGYQTGAQISQANAGNFASLLGSQATAGVGPTTVQQSSGIGGFLGQVGGGLLGSALGPIGTSIGAKVGGQLFGDKYSTNQPQLREY